MCAAAVLATKGTLKSEPYKAAMTMTALGLENNVSKFYPSRD